MGFITSIVLIGILILAIVSVFVFTDIFSSLLKGCLLGFVVLIVGYALFFFSLFLGFGLFVWIG